MSITNNFYVYRLVDSNTNIPFYIGKGKNKRAESHIIDAISNSKKKKKLSHKENKILSILAGGHVVNIEYVQEGLEESEAFSLEVKEIEMWGRYDLGKGPLTNKTNGGDGPTGYIKTQKEKTEHATKMKVIMSNPEIRSVLSDKAKSQWTEEYRAWQSEFQRNYWADPEVRKQHSERQKNSPKNRSKMGWDHPNMTESALLVWRRASDIAKHVGSGCGTILLLCDLPKECSRAVENMRARIKKGWEPDKDPNWIAWSASFDT